MILINCHFSKEKAVNVGDREYVAVDWRGDSNGALLHIEGFRVLAWKT